MCNFKFGISHAILLVGILVFSVLNEKPILSEVIQTKNGSFSSRPDLIHVNETPRNGEAFRLLLFWIVLVDNPRQNETRIEVRHSYQIFTPFSGLQPQRTDSKRTRFCLSSTQSHPFNVNISLLNECGGFPTITDKHSYFKSIRVVRRIHSYATNFYPWPVLKDDRISRRFYSVARFPSLPTDYSKGEEQSPRAYTVRPTENIVSEFPTWRVPVGLLGIAICMYGIAREKDPVVRGSALVIGITGVLLVLTGYDNRNEKNDKRQSSAYPNHSLHDAEKVSQESLTPIVYL
jgi:hypothetical protein